MYVQNLLSKIFSYLPRVDKQSIRREFKHAFSMGTLCENKPLNEQELAVVMKLITIIENRKLTIPTALFLECMQPLNYIGSQMMVFFRPFLTFFFTPLEYDLFQGILEKREGIKMIIEELEKLTIYPKEANRAKQKPKQK